MVNKMQPIHSNVANKGHMPKLKFIYAEPEPVHMGLVYHRACADPGIFVGGGGGGGGGGV